jgi:hypothetical protein
MRNAFLTCAVIFACSSTRAQDSISSAAGSKPANLAAERCKAVEGYFQSAANKDLYIHATALDSKLLVKYLWSNSEDSLYPESELLFGNRKAGDNGVQVVFSKDASGSVNSVSIGDEVWNRINAYKPVAKKEFPHSPEQLKRFEGIYHFANDTNALVQFMTMGNELILKDNQETHLSMESEYSFHKKGNLWFTVDFTKDVDGHIKQALIIKRQVLVKNPKPNISTAQLRSYEGKYQSKKDPDNILQLTAKNKLLVIRQLWDGKEIVVTPLADLYFYNSADAYSLQFVRDNDGLVRQAWLFNTIEFDKQTTPAQ